MKTIKIFAILLGLIGLTGLTSCKKEADLISLDTPQPVLEASTYCTLDFSWKPISNAVQYGYKLTNVDDESTTSGVTLETKASFTDLKAATSYKLEVWAFAAMDGDYSTPKPGELTVSTDGLTKLDTPVVTVDIKAGNNATVKWAAVEHAERYTYSATDSQNQVIKSGSTKTCLVSLKNLSPGDYTFTVYATTTENGYCNGDESVTHFTIP